MPCWVFDIGGGDLGFCACVCVVWGKWFSFGLGSLVDGATKLVR